MKERPQTFREKFMNVMRGDRIIGIVTAALIASSSERVEDPRKTTKDVHRRPR